MAADGQDIMRWLTAWREYLEARRMQKFYSFFIDELHEQGKAKTIFVIDGVCEDCPGNCEGLCDQDGIDCD